MDFEFVTTSSFVGNTAVFVANAEPDTANASDVNVKSDFKDFIKTPVLLLDRFHERTCMLRLLFTKLVQNKKRP